MMRVLIVMMSCSSLWRVSRRFDKFPNTLKSDKHIFKTLHTVNDFFSSNNLCRLSILGAFVRFAAILSGFGLFFFSLLFAIISFTTNTIIIVSTTHFKYSFCRFSLLLAIVCRVFVMYVFFEMLDKHSRDIAAGLVP